MPCENYFGQFQTSPCTSEPFEIIGKKDSFIIKSEKNVYDTNTEKETKTVSSIGKPLFSEIHQGETIEIAQKTYGQQSVIEMDNNFDDKCSIQGDQSDESISSLQEFEKLELAISTQHKLSPQSNGSLLGRTFQNSKEVNDIPRFQTEYKQSEKECAEAEYSLVKEGSLKFLDNGSQERLENTESSDSEDYEKRISEIANIIWQAQTNIEQAYSDHDQSLLEHSGFAFGMPHYNKTGSSLSTESSLMEKTPSQKDDNDADSLDGNEQFNGQQLAFKVSATEITKQTLAPEKAAHSVVLPYDILGGITVNNNPAENCVSHLQTLSYALTQYDSGSLKEIGADVENVKFGSNHKPYLFLDQGNENYVAVDEDRDSLNDESDYSMQEDSLHEKMDAHAEEDSLHDDISTDIDSLAEEKADKDSLQEEKDLDQDSLHEEMELPDDYEDILIDNNKSSKEIDNKISWSQEHPPEEEYDKDSLKDEFVFGQDLNSNDNNIQDIKDSMISSTDSLEPSSYFAIHANCDLKTNSATSSSIVNKFLSSGEESTWVNRSDSSVTEVSLSYSVKNIPGITKTCQLSNKEQVENFHKEDQFHLVSHSLNQPIKITSYFSEGNDEHFLDTDTPQTLKKHAEFLGTGKLLETKEEIETVDEKRNSFAVCGIKMNLQYESQKSSTEQEDNVEGRFRSFLKQQTLEVGEKKKNIEKNQIVDETGNVVITRIRKTHLKAKPQINKKICESSNAEEKTKEFFENFDSLQHTIEDENYYEKADEDGNVVCATQKFVKPEIHKATLSNLDAEKQMEDFTKRWSEYHDDELMTKISHSERLQIHTCESYIAHDSSGGDHCSTQMESYPTQPSQSTPTLSNIHATFPLYNMLEPDNSSSKDVREWTSEREQERQHEIENDNGGSHWTAQSTAGMRSLTTHVITTTGTNCQQYRLTDTSVQHGDRDEQKYDNPTQEVLSQFMTDDGNQ
ncbi:uncharacterized protein LOC143252769 [Tachypleus tridentatus]|uniref:uncharacterized protein LOC143252769 n=1 Tax=Tachypleus tridentatus TaxID=6853 RepID=UPI003FD0DD89